MSSQHQCQDCGSFVKLSTTHFKSSKCLKAQQINMNYQFKCRKCGLCIEKQWHTASHICGSTRVYDAELEELKLRCKFYSEFIRVMGVSLEVDWEEVKAGTFTVPIPPRIAMLNYSTDEEETEEEENESEGDESEDIEKVNFTPITTVVTVAPAVDKLVSIQGLNSMLLSGNRQSADGEDRYYILGNKLGEFVSESTHSPHSHTVFADLKKLFDKIRNTIDEREHFINGLSDSFCGQHIIAYILLSIDMFDQSLRFDWEKLNHDNSDFNLVSAILPLNIFIENVTKKYICVGQQYYTSESLVLDPWMLDITMSLSDKILEVCVPLFRKVFKSVYNDNVYRENWRTHPFLAQFINVFKNVEIASTIFDLNHLLRKGVNSVSDVTIPPQKPSLNRIDEWSLMNTRIATGIPAFDTSNFFETLFDDNTSKISEVWMKKYLNGLKCMMKEYIPSPRFRLQVEEEAKQYL